MRRFPPPWSVEDTAACFIVRDQHGQALAYVYFEDEQVAVMTRDQPRRVKHEPRCNLGRPEGSTCYPFRSPASTKDVLV
jgi:hypothetical protein